MDARVVSNRLHAAGDGRYLDFVDGIRALAVVLVLWFHISNTTLTGGYVGVDVFFVISGFLITRICLSKNFSFGSFWYARCRRILPAYLATMVVAGILSSVILLPDEAAQAARSLFAAPFMLQNFVFWKQTSYFSPTLETNPFLHTWTLAVEWQFYLALPLLTMVLRHRHGLLWAALVVVFVASFVLSVWGAIYKPTPTFYLVPFRAWEFLIGSFIAMTSTRLLPGAILSSAVSVAGLIAIVFAAVVFTSKTIFPGFTALLPCLGAGALIWGGLRNPESWTCRALSLPPVRALGQASYSIYLVHWPIIVFVRYIWVHDEPFAVTIAIVAASVGLGFLSWRFIEQPFRKKSDKGPLRRTAATAGAASFISAIAAVLLFTVGFPQRVPDAVQAIEAAGKDNGNFRHCLGFEAPETLEFSKCRLGSQGPVRLVLWGDSTAAALADGLSEEARHKGVSGVFVGADSCPPVPGMSGGFLQARGICSRIQADLPALLKRDPVDVLLVEAAWVGHWSRNVDTFSSEIARAFADYMTLAHRVVIVGPVPAARMNLPSGLARLSYFGNRDSYLGPENLDEIVQVNELVKQAAYKQGFQFVDLLSQICTMDCSMTFDGKPIYFDNGHITETTSKRLARENSNILLGDLQP
ncbi:Peptidoglycan/LPS O-acetylase OafA/YrhL, contains acyltransferase and SGNH-hydrolase domains [Rhizobium sp. NFR07]|uniref:acyltransferase family protein n=1 Tax=Rhizobium sp. NFR07 TaxID=1566262 RepID=UPI0008EB67A6|nr:acyltransferase family protein [Rhizobium sp. NFR07]SFB52153.1 Peptidoglycan/LPS O-acetylase OafA/YrhL, contains acyltransferase and SGNH-hydrolase domains [Rhizobium sp. NFR07]